MFGIPKDGRGLRNRVRELRGDQRGAGMSMEAIVIVAVAVLILAAVLRLAISRGGAVDQTHANIDSLVNGENVTAGSLPTNTPAASQSGADGWVPPTLANPPASGDQPGNEHRWTDGMGRRIAETVAVDGATKFGKNYIKHRVADAAMQASRENALKWTSGTVSAIQGVGGLLDAERESKALIQAGRGEDALANSFAAAGRFVCEVIPFHKIPYVGIPAKVVVSETAGFVGDTLAHVLFDPLNRGAHALAAQPWWPKDRGPRQPLPKLETGIHVGGRDLNLGFNPWGTHQYLVLVPEDPSKFDDVRDLGNGTQGIVVGAHNRNGRLQAEPFEKADVKATQEYVNPTEYRPWFGSFSPEFHQVDLNGKPVDQEIRKTLQAVDNYKEHENEHQIEYPSILGQFKSDCINSNSWPHSVIENTIGKDLVPEDYWGIDTCRENRIDSSYFLPEKQGEDLAVSLGSPLDLEEVLESVRRLLESYFSRVNELWTTGQPTSPGGGTSQPDSGANQIVSASDVRAAYARTVLKEAGVDVNDATNDATTPSMSMVSDKSQVGSRGAEPTDRYFDAVNQRLHSVRGKGAEAARRVLAEIADERRAGTFPQ